MKILQVIPYFVPAYGYGGPLKNCYYLSKELVEMGYEVTVVTTDALDKKNRIKKLKEEIDGIKVIRFRNVSNYLAKNFNGYFPIGFYGWAKKNIKKFDVVHCHDFFTYQNIVSAKICFKTNTPLVIQPRGVLSEISINTRFSYIKNKLLHLLENYFKKSATLVATSEVEVKEIEKKYPILKNKIPIVYNGVDIDEFRNVKDIEIHNKFNIPKQNKIIGYIGRVQYIKGIDISLEILALLKNKLKFTYLIVGPDEQYEKERLIQKAKKLEIEDSILFTGLLTGLEKLETMKACDIFLFTSRSEGTPMTAIEAAALGVPQIISRSCPISVIINKYKAGFAYDLEEKHKMANRIYTILNDKNLYNATSKNARLAVRQELDLNIVVEKFSAIYKSVIKK